MRQRRVSRIRDTGTCILLTELLLSRYDDDTHIYFERFERFRVDD